jgi:beta-glucosidase/6-phospho-beta-glucosidase/beta-galactosidase
MLHTKFIAIAALALTLGTTNAFAGPAHGLNGQVNSAFQKDFKKAELVDYTSGKDFTRLTLKTNDMIVFAYYSENGDLLAVTRNIKSTQLPLSLLLDLKKNYTGYWITDLFEMSTGTQSSYYMTMENADKKLNLRSVNNDSWETFKKESKD